VTAQTNDTITIDIQNPLGLSDIPTPRALQQAVASVCQKFNDGNCEITLRFVDEKESQSLNLSYRNKDKPTNVLSFPSELPDFIPSDFIGDLVLCHSVITAEAKQQNKRLDHHYIHLCVHGTLHLLGFDHINDDEAEVMEQHEIQLLAQLGIDDPYQDH